MIGGGEFAGALRERVSIEQRSVTRSPTGLVEGPWTVLARCYADVRIDGSGAGPELEGMALSAMPRFRITLRRRGDLNLAQRLRWGARLLMIRQIIDDPATPDRLTLRCEEWRAA